MEYIVQTSNKASKKYIEMILPTMLRHMKLDKLDKCLVISEEKDCEDMGMTVNFDMIKGYIIVMQSNMSPRDIGTTLAHELVHVKQLASGLLKQIGRGSHTWIGKKYVASTPYYSRPWEIAAFSKQELIFRQVLEKVSKGLK